MRLDVRRAVPTALLLLAAGCGSAGGGGDVTAEPEPGGGADSGRATELTVTVRTGGGQRAETYTLRCDPPGGDHPDPEAACRSLRDMDQPFAPVPPDAMCTEIYGGPQTAEVTGTFRGEPVDTSFSRTNGCHIARWDKHVTLLVETGGVDTR